MAGRLCVEGVRTVLHLAAKCSTTGLLCVRKVASLFLMVSSLSSTRPDVSALCSNLLVIVSGLASKLRINVHGPICNEEVRKMVMFKSRESFNPRSEHLRSSETHHIYLDAEIFTLVIINVWKVVEIT